MQDELSKDGTDKGLPASEKRVLPFPSSSSFITGSLCDNAICTSRSWYAFNLYRRPARECGSIYEYERTSQEYSFNHACSGPSPFAWTTSPQYSKAQSLSVQAQTAPHRKIMFSRRKRTTLRVVGNVSSHCWHPSFHCVVNVVRALIVVSNLVGNRAFSPSNFSLRHFFTCLPS